MSKAPSRYLVQSYAADDFAVVRRGPLGGLYVIGRYRLEQAAQLVARSLTDAEEVRRR